MSANIGALAFGSFAVLTLADWESGAPLPSADFVVVTDTVGQVRGLVDAGRVDPRPTSARTAPPAALTVRDDLSSDVLVSELALSLLDAEPDAAGVVLMAAEGRIHGVAPIWQVDAVIASTDVDGLTMGPAGDGAGDASFPAVPPTSATVPGIALVCTCRWPGCGQPNVLVSPYYRLRPPECSGTTLPGHPLLLRPANANGQP